MMKLFKQNKRGVSPVLGAVIMTLIVVTGLGLFFGYVITYSSDFQANSGSAILESLVIENYWFEDSDTVILWISNVGKVSFEIQDIYIDGFRANSFVSSPSEFNIEGYPTSFGNVTIDSFVRFDDNNGYPYTLRLITKRGAVFEESLYYNKGVN